MVDALRQAPTADPWADLAEVVEVLRAADSEAAQRHADALERFAHEGGSLQALLQLRRPRGSAQSLPHRAEKRERRDEALRQIAAGLSGDPMERARRLAELIAARDPRTTVLHQVGDPVPSSPRHLVRILRADSP